MRAKEIDVIRTLVIIALVMFHAMAPYCGGWAPMSAGNAALDWVYKWLGHLSYAGMLETFVAISGYVYCLAESRRREPQTVPALVTAKLKRLIVPALIWGAAYWLIFRGGGVLSGLWSVANGIGHLWFLPMLFWCFLLEKAVVLRFKVPLWVLAIVAVVPYPALPISFNNALFYLFFFHLGFKLYGARDAFLRMAKWSNMCYLLAVALPLLILATELRGSVNLPAMGLIEKRAMICLFTSLRLIYSTAIVLAYFIVGFRLMDGRAYRAFKFIAACSFGIYLLQEFIIRYFYYYTDSVFHAYPSIMPWVGFVLGFALSMAVVAIVRLSKFGRNIF